MKLILLFPGDRAPAPRVRGYSRLTKPSRHSACAPYGNHNERRKSLPIPKATPPASNCDRAEMAHSEDITGPQIALRGCVCGESLHVHRAIGVTRGILVIAALMLLSIARPSYAQPRAIDLTRSTVTVRVFKSGLFRAFADDHVIEAHLVEGTIDDSATPSVRIAIDVRGMSVLDPGLSQKDRQEVQARMLSSEVLDADRFPRIRFRSLSIQGVAVDHWSVRGELEVHGQARPVTVEVVREQGHYKGSSPLKQSEFGITPVSIAGGTVKVKDEMKIDFDIVAAER